MSQPRLVHLRVHLRPFAHLYVRQRLCVPPSVPQHLLMHPVHLFALRNHVHAFHVPQRLAARILAHGLCKTNADR